MTIAVNDKTGEVLQLQNNQWVPATIAQNDKGDRLVLDEGQWKQVPTTKPKEPPKRAPREFSPGILGGLQRLSASLEAPLPSSFGPRFAGGLQNLPEGFAQSLALTTEGSPLFPQVQPGTAEGITETFGQRRQALREQFPGTAGEIGEIAGEIAPAFLVNPQSAARTLTQRMGLGARIGGLFGAGQLTEPTQQAKGTSVLKGAGLGATVPVVTGGLARTIRPQTRPQVTQLMEEGVTPTPGQILGGGFQRAEEGLTSVPFVGDVIRAGQRRAVSEFNTAAMNRALEPIGKALPKGSAGREAVTKASELISNAYDDIFSKLKTVEADDIFIRQIGLIGRAGQRMSSDQARMLENIIKRDVTDRFVNGKVSGRLFKKIYSKLGMHVRRFGKSENPDHQMLSEAIVATQDALKRAVARASPEASASLRKADRAFANMVRVENAAGRIGAKEGIFTPAQLRAAVRTTDTSGRHRAFARGQALMQDLAESGESVLGATVPDSGTPFRSLMATGLPGLISTAATSPLAPMFTPAGQRAMASILTQRPETAGLLAGSLRATSPRLSAIAGLLGEE